ncbi:hypothetical protein BKA66DRAFT_467101 [Pyrenochaeta sp. MPI-SDFR-AT-0127]|nr:hypothetical protein BKA66DRAFT_467101 [Pyrenochaeta sp. MPI-SDFR-AT-0127]
MSGSGFHEDMLKGRTSTTTGDVHQHHHILRQIQRTLEALSSQQEELAGIRERVLVDREIALSNRKRIREQLIRAGDAEAELMNAFRKLYNGPDISIPADLASAYSAAEEERNKLGYLEDNYLRSEQDLGVSEWNLMELENDLYQYDLQQLISKEILETLLAPKKNMKKKSASDLNSMPPSLAIQYQVATARHDRLLKQFNSLRRVKAGSIDIFDRGDTSRETGSAISEDDEYISGQFFSEVLSQITDCEVELQHLKAELKPEWSMETLRVQHLSEPTFRKEQDHVSVMSSARARSVSGASTFTDDLPVQNRIKNWLLDCLKKSAIEKTQYLNILGHNFNTPGDLELNFDDWNDRVTHFWPSDTADPIQSYLSDPALGKCHTSRGIEIDGGSESSQRGDDASYRGQDPQNFGLSFDANFNYEPISTHTALFEAEESQIQADEVSVVEGQKFSSWKPVTQNETCPADSLSQTQTILQETPMTSSNETNHQSMNSGASGVNDSALLQDISGGVERIQISPFVDDPRPSDPPRQPSSNEDFKANEMESLFPNRPESRQSEVVYSTEHTQSVSTHQDLHWRGPNPLMIDFSHKSRQDDTNVRDERPGSKFGSFSSASSLSTAPKSYNESYPPYHAGISMPLQSSLNIVPFDRAHHLAQSNTYKTPMNITGGLPDYLWDYGYTEPFQPTGGKFQSIAPIKQCDFFVTGRVFKMMCLEPASGKLCDLSQSSRESSPVRFQRTMNARQCSLVVFCNEGSSSLCFLIRANNAGYMRELGWSRQKISIMCISEPSQSSISREAVAVRPLQVILSGDEILSAGSRVNLGQIYQINNSIAVKDVGMVSGDQLHLLQAYHTTSGQGTHGQNYEGAGTSHTLRQ